LAEQCLESPRLVLRPHVREDFPQVAALWRDPQVTRFIGGRPFSEEESWTRLLRYIGHWVALGFGYWTVRELDSGRFVGEVGFADYRREIEPGFDGAPEIGWALAPWAWGRGYAAEAVRTAQAWADVRFDGARTVCIISPENMASIAVAQKCGYAFAGKALYHGAEVQVYVRGDTSERR
jgi:RimJ/RimL family protein N-acetyltransferase